MTLVATLAELKTRLRKTDVADDAELTDYLTAASEIVEHYLNGPLSVTSFTQTVYHEGPIRPDKRPLVAVTSITSYQGAALDAATYRVDTGMGLISPLGVFWGTLPATLVYTAGLSAIPARVKRAGLEMAWHLWLMKNGSGGRGYPGSDETTVSALGYAVPRRVVQLLQPDRPVMVG